MPDDYVTLRTCADVHSAAFLKSVLEGSGIEAIIPHESVSSILPHLVAASGGVRILVRAVDAERAAEILQATD
jgi:hypothetical protein